MKRSLLIIFICVFSNSITYGRHRASRLKVTQNGHYLQYEDGTPFFGLGNTGWNLFYMQKLNYINDCLDNRAAKRFNVVQAVALAKPDGIRELNRHGQVSLKNLDPIQPADNQYFLLIDSTELFRFHREVAGVLAFDYLSSNYGMTGDWFIDKIKDLTSGSTLKWFKYCFAPSAVFIDLDDQKILRLKIFHNQVKRPCYSYRGSFSEKLISHFFDFKKSIFYSTAIKKKNDDQRYRKDLKPYNLGDDLVFNLIGVNYDSVTVKGSVNLYLLDADGHMVSSHSYTMKIPLFLTALLPVKHKLPEKRRGYLLARAYTREGNKEPVISRRYIKVGTVNSYDI